jgi:hypothetical protein
MSDLLPYRHGESRPHAKPLVWGLDGDRHRPGLCHLVARSSAWIGPRLIIRLPGAAV